MLGGWGIVKEAPSFRPSLPSSPACFGVDARKGPGRGPDPGGVALFARPPSPGWRKAPRPAENHPPAP